MKKVFIHKDGRIVSRSQNLRGIMDYSRKHGIKSANVLPVVMKAARAEVRIVFGDDAWVQTYFASETIARRFCTRRMDKYGVTP